jgi:formylglycine-generating enzyme required for sulfatase activity
MTNCGTGTESCCTSLDVTGGSFGRTYPAPGPTSIADPATVSGFRLDKYLVTVGRFRQFVSAEIAGWTPTAGAGKHTHLNGGNGLAAVPLDAGLAYESGWEVAWTSSLPMTENTWDASLTTFAQYATWTPSPGINENLPIVLTSWLEAYAFCIWDGGFLPSDTELEYAAAGGNQQRPYPWGQNGPQGGATTYSGSDLLLLLADGRPGLPARDHEHCARRDGEGCRAVGSARPGRRGDRVDDGLVRELREPVCRLFVSDANLRPSAAGRRIPGLL